jgi:uncharacterized protein YdaU (DUF1376 family)
MKNSPSFQFYPQDFLADINVQDMTMKELGIYIKLLCHCWIEDGLPVGSRVVQRWFKQGSTVARCFYEKEGFYRNERLDIERQKQVDWREKSRLGGIHSADNKKVIKGGSRVVQPRANSSTSSSTSSSIKNHKNDSKRDGRIQSEFDPLFDEFWDGYPKKVGKEVAREKFMILARGGKITELIKATNGYMDYLKSQRVHKNFDQEPMNPATFLMKERWRDYIEFKYEPPM